MVILHYLPGTRHQKVSTQCSHMSMMGRTLDVGHRHVFWYSLCLTFGSILFTENSGFASILLILV